MNNEESRVLQNRLIMERPVNNTIVCCIEEMSELTKVLTKYLRDSHKFSIDSLTEEVAHVLLMVDTMKETFVLNETKINDEILIALQKCFPPKEEK